MRGVVCTGRRSISRLPALLLLGFLSLFLFQAACDSPPQILEISPGKGARDIPTNAPIRIKFDRPLDKASVAARFGLRPKVGGQISWETPNLLVFQHDTLDVSTEYQVVITSGYRDTAGNANTFNHSWTFRTEPPPELRGSAPAQGEGQVDPAIYVAMSFSREMNVDSFRGSVTVSPSISVLVQADPSDAKRILIAPTSLLTPHTDYDVLISGDVTDQDGNHLRPVRLHFATGAARPLSHWITFIASEAGASAGSGIWMVDDSGFPRRLEDTPAVGFSWTPDGSNLLVRHSDDSWTDYPIGSDASGLPFIAEWAGYLGPRDGYVYLNGSELSRLLPEGASTSIANGISGAAISHDLNRIAFSQSVPDGTDIRAYDVELRAQYRVQHEVAPVTELTWSPDGTKLAYLVSLGPGGQLALRVKSLTGRAAATTIASGQIADLAWLADSSDLTFTAQVSISGKLLSRIFRVNTALPPAQLSGAAAIGPATEADVFQPQPSPDGHQIAFLLGRGDSAQIWLMNSDGTSPGRLTGFDPAAFPYSCRDLHWASP
jgi:hypothetical protein